MAHYKVAEALTSLKEGGYANDKDDTGGRTLNGIAQKKNPQWEGWPRVTAIIGRVGESAARIDAEVKKDPWLQESISNFYKRSYCDALACH